MAIRRFIGKIGRQAVAVLAAAMLAGLWSCEKIYDYEGDCDPHWQVRFVWDYNWDFADGFPGAMGVGSVHLYVFDAATHKLVLDRMEVAGAEGFAKDYAMPLEDLPMGRYDFVAWCGPAMEDRERKSFTDSGIPDTFDGGSEAWRLSAGVTEGTADQRRLAALYYGRNGGVEITDEQGVHTVTVNLMKDTNEFTFLLQHTSGPLNPDDFDIEIRDDNKALRWDNGLMPGEQQFPYRPWRTFNGGAEVEGAVNVPGRESDFLVAKLSTSRLVLRDDSGSEPHLVITNRRTGAEVFNIPLLRYLLLPEEHKERQDAHGKVQPVDDQEYLDRVDSWRMQFYLGDKDGGWYALDLHILGWHVIEWDENL